MIVIEGKLVKTDRPETHRLHRTAFDADIYFSMGLLLEGESEADFEEVELANIPQPEEDEEL